MNELYAIEPTVFKTANELRSYLRSFGPMTGRYIEKCPKAWIFDVIKQFENFGELEQKRVRSCLERALECSAIVDIKKRDWWNSHKSWKDNASMARDQKTLGYEYIVQNNEEVSDGSDDLSPTSEERIAAIPSEYRRVCEIFSRISSELYFIDPYLKIDVKSVKEVVTALLEELYLGKTKEITFITRGSEIFKDRDQETIIKVFKGIILDIAKKVNLKKGTRIKFLFVDDSEERMHGRYLLSNKGGIRLDQGFQSLSHPRKVDVGPVGKKNYEDLYSTYVDNNNNFKIMGEIDFPY